MYLIQQDWSNHEQVHVTSGVLIQDLTCDMRVSHRQSQRKRAKSAMLRQLRAQLQKWVSWRKGHLKWAGCLFGKFKGWWWWWWWWWSCRSPKVNPKMVLWHIFFLSWSLGKRNHCFCSTVLVKKIRWLEMYWDFGPILHLQMIGSQKQRQYWVKVESPEHEGFNRNSNNCPPAEDHLEGYVHHFPDYPTCITCHPSRPTSTHLITHGNAGQFWTPKWPNLDHSKTISRLCEESESRSGAASSRHGQTLRSSWSPPGAWCRKAEVSSGADGRNGDGVLYVYDYVCMFLNSWSIFEWIFTNSYLCGNLAIK